MMKKYLLIAILTIFFSCEKDDFCTENPVTPNLIIRFMDASNTKLTKKVNSLYIWAEAKDTIYKNVSLDSISIPLNTLTKKTIYNFSKGNDSINKITIEYTTKEEYVSRSCGYKVIFNNLKVSKSSSQKPWINKILTTTKTINNQNNAHIKIYH